MEGVGELSLCKVCCSGNLTTAISSETVLSGDIRSHLMVSTEEGDVIFADICARKSADQSSHVGKDDKDKDEEDEVEASREYVRWISRDHSRPCVGLQQSPFFPDILLSVGDWSFHIWRVRFVKNTFDKLNLLLNNFFNFGDKNISLFLTSPLICTHVKFLLTQVGEDKPLFVSPQSSSYLTGGAWSPTRPAVLLVACDTGELMD